MEANTNKPRGSINISDATILKVAETAAAETEGVYSVDKQLASAGSGVKLFTKAVRLKHNGESAAIMLDIAVLDGFNAVSVAEDVQKNVKDAVQGMTNYAVTRVDVRVTGIKFKK